VTQRFWMQHGPRLAWLTLLGLAVVVGGSGVRGFTQSRGLGGRVEAVAAQLYPAAAEPETSTGPGGQGGSRRRPPTTNTGSPADAAVLRITERHLFMQAPRQGFRSVQGVLGDRVLYSGGRSFGLGENAMGATVIALGTNWVELEHDGKTITVDVFRGQERSPEQLRWDGQTPPPSAASGQADPRSDRHTRRTGRRRGQRQSGEHQPRSDRSQNQPPDAHANPDAKTADFVAAPAAAEDSESPAAP